MTWSENRGSYGLVRCGDQGAGSCGLLVRKLDDPQARYLLSAAHVLSALPWEGGVRGAEVSGVSDIHGANPVPVATLAEVTSFSTAGAAEGDAAIAKLALREMSPSVGPIVPNGISNFISEEIKVKMYSAVRGKLATGMVRAVRQRGPLDYYSPAGRRVPINFNDYVKCDYASTPGDSGSPVFNVLDQVVGIHIWGNATTGESIFLPVAPLMKHFKLELWSEVIEAPHILARTLWGEARGEGRAGMEAVACVVMNRLKKGGQGDSIDDVCLKKYQFSCWNKDDPNLDKLLSLQPGDAGFQTCLDIEAVAQRGELRDTTFGATHYHAGSVAPLWAAGRGPCAVIGHHLFYNDID